MRNKLLITGGVLRSNGFELGEGKYYEAAKLLRLDCESGDIEELLNVNEGNANFPDEHPNLEFTIGCTEGDKLWLSTDTEIRLYSYPALDLLKTYSHPCFHNVHSVAVRGNQLYVTSTGLDTVVILDRDSGNIIDYLNAEGKPTWHRFSPETDYRKLHSTRPHDAHPNFVFWLNDQPWVTRCTQEDAVCLHDVRQRIDISGPDKEISVHDGLVYDGKVFFTSVDGCLVVADAETHRTLETIPLFDLPGFGGIRGWCRGLFIEDGLFYFGFSRLRQTKSLSKLKWVKSLLDQRAVHQEASVLVFDYARREIVSAFVIPKDMIDAVYTILPEPDAA